MVGVAAVRLLGHGFPWATLLVNVLGSLAMGALVVLLAQKDADPFGAFADDRAARWIYDVFGVFAGCCDALRARADCCGGGICHDLCGVFDRRAVCGYDPYERSPPMSGVQMITVEAGEGDQRLDRWLKRRFPLLKQGQIEKMCPQGRLARRRRAGENLGPAWKRGRTCAFRRCPKRPRPNMRRQARFRRLTPK